jgi:hypothetical protein
MRARLQRLGVPLLHASLRVARFYRPGFHETSEHVYRAAERTGVYPLIDHYHEPPVRNVPAPPRRRKLHVDLASDRQLELLATLRYGDELSAISRAATTPTAPYYDNPAFAAPDAQAYHSLIRRFRPARVVEVGSGQSTRFAANALTLSGGGELVAIEPYEAPELDLLGATVVRERVEEVGGELFETLGENDMLFIDSSHVVRPGGDVTFLLLEVVPALRPGVLVHVHDVFTPADYPAEWQRRRWLWSEQYVVEALLTGNAYLEVLLAIPYLLAAHPHELAAAFPVPAAPQPAPTPSSLWLRIRA